MAAPEVKVHDACTHAVGGTGLLRVEWGRDRICIMTATPSPSMTNPTSARRVQYRVGHGGFHATFVNPTGKTSEQLTYVYDVGAKPDKNGHLLPAIESFVGTLSTYGTVQVDYVFLSHIDEDHVNGLRELLDALKNHTPMIPVKNVVLPWLSPIQKLITQSRNNHRQPATAVTNLTGPDAEADGFLEQLGAENVIRVTTDGEDPPPITSSTTTPAGHTVVTAAPAGWVLLPIKTPTPPGFEAKFLTKLTHLLSPHCLNPNNTGDHERILTHHRSLVSNAMETVASLVGVSAKHIANWSSLALLHGGSTPAQACVITTPGSFHADVRCAHGWLHTGDLPLKNAAVWSNLSLELGKTALASPLCALVAPHHGSGHDHEDALYNTAKPGTVILTSGKKLSGPNIGKPSYSYNHASVHNKAALAGASTIELDNR